MMNSESPRAARISFGDFIVDEFTMHRKFERARAASLIKFHRDKYIYNPPLELYWEGRRG
jgi:hypothetical protein